MGNLKRFIFGIVLVFIVVFTIEVEASTVPWYWTINGKDITEGNTSTTASLDKGSEVITLKLNNYNGKGFVLECLGSCPTTGYKFVIDLTGENIIKDDKIGIDFANHEGKIEFTGSGSLKISAPTPISYEDYQSDMYIVPSEKYYSGKKTKQQEEAKNKEETQKEDTPKKDNYLTFYVVFGIIGALLLIAIIFKAIKNTKNKKEA